MRTALQACANGVPGSVPLVQSAPQGGRTLAEGLMNFGVIASEVHARMLKMRLATNLRYRVRL